MMSGKAWLTFLNSTSLTEKAIREEFSEFGQVTECDGAVGSNGWVMVAFKTRAMAKEALDILRARDSGGGLGDTLRFLDGAGEEDVEMKSEESSSFPQPVPADKADGLKSKLVENGVAGHTAVKKDLKEVAMGGLTHFTKVNQKILEMVSLNNTLLMERVREVEEKSGRELSEKDDQIKRLQNLLVGKDDQIKKLTSKLSTSAEFEEKASKFFGENEDFHKKKLEDLTKANKELKDKLSESENRRMENLLEEADSTKIRETVTSLASITEDIQSKTEQVWAVVQGMDSAGIPGPASDGEKSREPASSTMGLLHNKVDKMIRLMVETSENQKKMNKVLQDLLKSGFNKTEQTVVASVPEKEEREKDKDRDKDKEREREDRDERDRKRKRRDRDRSREKGEREGSRDKRSKSPEAGPDSATSGPQQVNERLGKLQIVLIDVSLRSTQNTRNSSGG